MKNIGFVILTWNSEKYISKCLESILKIDCYNVFVSVTDNGSTDNTVEILKKYTNTNKNIIVTYLKKNEGTTKPRNIAIKALPPVDYIVIFDSDAFVDDKDNFVKLFDVLNEHPEYGIIGPRLTNLEGELQPSGRNLPRFRDKLAKVSLCKKRRKAAEERETVDYSKQPDLFPVGYLMSACWAFKSELVNKIGYLDEKLFYAPEDVEYCARCWVNGLKVGYYQKVHATHVWTRLSRKKLFSKHNFEHIKGLLYFRRHYNPSKIEIK